MYIINSHTTSTIMYCLYDSGCGLSKWCCRSQAKPVHGTITVRHLTLFHFCQTYKKVRNQDVAFVSRRSRRCQLTPGRFRPPSNVDSTAAPLSSIDHRIDYSPLIPTPHIWKWNNCRFNRRPHRPHQYHRVRVAVLKSRIKQIFCCFGELRLHNDLAELPLLDGK